MLERSETSVNTQTMYGRTALHWATRMNYIEIVKLLLENSKINVNIHNIYLRTALYWAVRRDSVEIIKQLLARGAQAPDVIEECWDENVKTMLKNWKTYFAKVESVCSELLPVRV